MTVTRAALAEAVYLSGMDLTRGECLTMVDLTIAEITLALVNGERVGISKFGRFYLIQKAQRVGRNPKTGEGLVVRPRRTLMFRASQKLKARVARRLVI
jgi:integration host factor subunit alpha